jgi:GntR family transcriptional regulator/MocR family aminotransferase
LRKKHLKSSLPISVTIDSSSPTPLYRQLYTQIREGILQGRFPRQNLLPSTRGLAKELGVSRNTVITAFEQLLAEGYLEGKIGVGTYVTASLPEDSWLFRDDETKTKTLITTRELSKRGQLLASTPLSVSSEFGVDDGNLNAFQIGLPSLEDFPFDIWAKLSINYWKYPKYNILGYGHPGGYKALREIIAQYLAIVRAVKCSLEQVIIVNGAHQAFDLIARVLLDPGDHVWIEDPCFPGTKAIFQSSESKLVAVGVDEEGLNVEDGIKRSPNAALAYITPSYQFPLGVTMSLNRRLALLDWAHNSNAWIVEDDYVSELRYDMLPVASVQGLDQDERVIYVGTFSKILLPALRIGYLVVPKKLIKAFLNARAFAGRYSNPVDQAVLAEFISQGHLSRHIRRMCKLYGTRQKALVDFLANNSEGLFTTTSIKAGAHLVAWLPREIDDKLLAAYLNQNQIICSPLSLYQLEKTQNPGLILGYTTLSVEEIERAAKKLVVLTKAFISENTIKIKNKG